MKVAVRWCDGTEPEWRGRSIQVFSGGRRSVIPIPDSDIICDCCNADLLAQGPFAVIEGCAYCQDCAADLFHVRPGMTEAEVRE